MKNLFKAIIIINLLLLLVIFMGGLISLSITSILSVGFFSWLYFKEEQAIRDNKNWILTIGILNFLSFKIVTGSLCISIYSKLKNGLDERNRLEKPKVDPQIRKVDILLKVGVLMVFIAGIIFATTSWNALNSILKIFLYLLVSFAFVGLSKFSEKRIKIKSTIYLYWILGMSFIIFLFLNAGYEGFFGSHLTFYGDGDLLYRSLLTLVISFTGLASYFNFKNNKFLYITYTFITLTIFYLLMQCNLLFEHFLLILIGIVTILNIIIGITNKQGTILYSYLKKLLIFLNLIFMVTNPLYTFDNSVITVVLSLLFVGNLYYLSINNKEDVISKLCPIFSFISLISIVSLLKFSDSITVIVLCIIAAIQYLICGFIKNSNLKKSTLITSNIIIGIYFISSISVVYWLPIVVALFSSIIYLINKFIVKGNENIELSIEPLKVLMLLWGIISIFDNLLKVNTGIYFYPLAQFLLVLIYSLLKEKKKAKAYQIYSLILVVSNFFIVPNIDLVIMITLFASTILFFMECDERQETSSSFNKTVFIVLIFNFIIRIIDIVTLITKNAFNINETLIACIIILGVFIFLRIFYRKDRFRSNTIMFSIGPVIATLLSSLNVNWIEMIIPSILFYYITFLIYSMIKSETIKDVIAYVGYSLAFIIVIFNSNSFVLTYSCIIILTSILLGYVSKKYNPLFRISIISLIIFILYQLKEFWNQIPAWLYLLVLGIGLIGFATYKQLKMAESSGTKKDSNDN